MDKMQIYILAKIWQFYEIFGTQITFDMFCTVKSLKDLKPRARSEFPNVWGE